MKSKARVVALASLAIACFPFPYARAQKLQERQLQQAESIKTLPGKNKRWALVIGVDDYSESQITKLSGAANDARTLADALIKYAGFPEDQVTLLASDQPQGLQPRRSTILRYLSNLRGLVPKDGLLLVSFAGHGIERGGRAFLLPSDALGVNDMALLEDTAISVERIKESIRATGVSQVILIVDACRSDPPLVPLSLKPQLAFAKRENYTSNSGQNWTRYWLTVTNRADYSNEMFAPAPSLPPCGLNSKASRTWVDIYNGDGKRIYGFCALMSSDNLANLWFALPQDRPPPLQIFVVPTDRQTNVKYKSPLLVIPHSQ